MPLMIKLYALLILASFSFVSCSSSLLRDTNSAKGAFEYAKELEDDELYEQALKKFAEVKNRHPYSRYAVEAELRIANIHFKRESYDDALGAYLVFKDLHPKHRKIDYVTNQLALCYFHQVPSTVDRDLSLANRAIRYFDEVIREHSKSEYVKEAKEKRKELRQKLAKKELYVADFYFIRDKYDSALLRYATFLKSFTDTKSLIPRALYGAGVSAAEVGEKKKASQFFDILIRRFSNSDEASDAKGAMKSYGL